MATPDCRGRQDRARCAEPGRAGRPRYRAPVRTAFSPSAQIQEAFHTKAAAIVSTVVVTVVVIIINYYPFGLQAVFCAPVGVHTLRRSSEAPKVKAL